MTAQQKRKPVPNKVKNDQVAKPSELIANISCDYSPTNILSCADLKQRVTIGFYEYSTVWSLKRINQCLKANSLLPSPQKEIAMIFTNYYSCSVCLNILEVFCHILHSRYLFTSIFILIL